MKIFELKNLIAGIEGAVNGRQNKTNFVIVPCEDGIVKISTAVAIDKDTKTHKAFNVEAATAEYRAWEKEVALKAAERANKPAKPAAGPNPEAEARRQALDAQIAGLPAFEGFTATDIMNALKGQLADNVTVMAIGSSAGRLVDAGVLTMETHKDEKNPKGKKYYSKA